MFRYFVFLVAGLCSVRVCQFWVTFPVSFELSAHRCPQESVENIMKEKMPKKGGRWWFSWRSRNTDSKSVRENAVRPNHPFAFTAGFGELNQLGSLCFVGNSDGSRRQRRQLINYGLSKQVPLHVVFLPSTIFFSFLNQTGFLWFLSFKDESSSSDEDHRISSQVSGSCQPETLLSSGAVCYKKTLRLTSDQLVQFLFLQLWNINTQINHFQ